VSYLSRSILDDANSPGHLARAHDTESRLEAGLRSLRPVYREVICLRAYCRMSYREIAKAMGLPSEQTASVLFLRARAELRKWL